MVNDINRQQKNLITIFYLNRAADVILPGPKNPLASPEISPFQDLKVKGAYSSLWDWEHMLSQSYGASLVTCHPTQVNAPRLNPSQLGRYFVYLPRRDGRLS